MVFTKYKVFAWLSLLPWYDIGFAAFAYYYALIDTSYGHKTSEYDIRVNLGKNSHWKSLSFHSGPENKKKVHAKKLMKSNKWISRKIFFDQIPVFSFKNGQKSIFELGKV